jgi:tight adherence protein B
VNDLAVLVIPAAAAAGVVLLALGVGGAARPARRPGVAGRASDWLAQAGVRGMRPWHLVALCCALAAPAGLGVAAMSRAVWLGLAFAGLAGALPVSVLRARRLRRSRELREVWPDAIDNLASGVRAGLSLPEAVAGLAEHGPEPLRAPLARFADDYHATGRFGAALDRLKDELADPTADRVVEALRLAREVGGSELGRTLRTLSGFLRDELRVRKELEARQTWVLVAARMAFVTPWVVLLLLATKPEAVAAYRGGGGAMVLAVGAAMATVGYRLMLAIGRLPSEERVLG